MNLSNILGCGEKKGSQMKVKKRYIAISTIVLGMILIGSYLYHLELPLTMVTSISSDGKYALMSTTDLRITLWDLKTKQQKTITTNGGLYSPYFIKNTHDFIYQQEKDNKVVVEDVNGKVIKTLQPGFATYGEVMTSDLKTYVASSENYDVYKISHNKKETLSVGYCIQDHNLKDYNGPLTNTCMDFIAAGKLLNFTLTEDDAYLIGAGSGNIFIWNLNSEQGWQFYAKESSVNATLSPDNKYIVGGGEMEGEIWKFPSGVKEQSLDWLSDDKIIPMPKDFGKPLGDFGTVYYSTDKREGMIGGGKSNYEIH